MGHPRRLVVAAALLAAALGGACFDGGFLVGRECVSDDDCGPTLKCFAGVCADPNSEDGLPAEVLWTEVLDAGNALDDEGLAIATRADGAALVAGYSARPNAPDDIALHLFDAEGALLRTTAPYTGAADDRMLGVTRALDDGFVAVGESSPDTETHVLLQGVEQFGGQSFTTNAVDLERSTGAGIIMNEDGSFTITGAIEGSDGLDVLIAGFGPGGGPDWDTSFDNGLDLDDRGHAIAGLPDGGLVITGSMTLADGTLDLWVGAFDADGGERWVVAHDEDDLDDEGLGVAVTSRGELVVAGATERDGEGRNIWVRKLEADGDKVWTHTYTSADEHDDLATGVAVDSENNIVVVGHVGGGGGGDADIWVRKLDGEDGVAIWTDIHDGPAGGDDRGYGVAVDDKDDVLATGSEEQEDGTLDVWVRKYAAYRAE